MPSTIPILSLANSTTRPEPDPTDLEKIPPTPRQSSWGRRWANLDFSRIPRLLLLGYPTEEKERRYEKDQDWECLHKVLKSKVENIVIVSGLVLVADTNFLISGDLRRMTYTALSASIFSSLLSIIFGCFCLWLLAHPIRLEVLVRHGFIFYYLCGSASIFGGVSALAFFVAVGSWTWLDDGAAGYGWGGKIGSISLGSVLVINAGVCFFLGASTDYIPLAELYSGESDLADDLSGHRH